MEINKIDIAILQDLKNLVEIAKKISEIIKEIKEKKEISIIDIAKYCNMTNMSMLIELQKLIEKLSLMLIKNFSPIDYKKIIEDIEKIEVQDEDE